jgi:alpha-tubulin suppressor-like RCC1 family protein
MKQILASGFLLSTLFSFSQQVDAGNGHAIILDKHNTVWTVGRNNHGQLGVNTVWYASLPVKVQLPPIKKIARGYDHTIAIDFDNKIWIWGNNNFGQLGLNHFTDQSIPVQINSESSFTDAAGGYTHSLFLKSDGSVWAVGSNIYGESGNSIPKSSSELNPVVNQNNLPLK